MPLDQARALHDQRLVALRAQLQTTLAGRDRFTLEIGSGHGHFLTAYAEHHPERFCVGIDIIEDRLARSLRKSARARLANIAWLHAEAGLFLEALEEHQRSSTTPTSALIAEIFVLFPDPWPKRRHWKNRLIQPEFLEALAARAGEGARLYFRTDHAPYFEAAVATFSEHPRWQLVPEVAWPFELSTVFQQRADAYQSCVVERISGGH